MNTTIQVSSNTRELLKVYGHKDETYDQIINKLISIANRNDFLEEQKNILKKEMFYRVEDL